MISQYNVTGKDRYGVPNMMLVVSKRLTIRGFIMLDPDFGPKYFDEHQRTVGKWIADDTFKPELHIVDGIDNAGEGLLSMFKGENFGKALLRVAEMSGGAGTATKGLVTATEGHKV